jgi:hypothetical protein
MLAGLQRSSSLIRHSVDSTSGRVLISFGYSINPSIIFCSGFYLI